MEKKRMENESKNNDEFLHPYCPYCAREMEKSGNELIRTTFPPMGEYTCARCRFQGFVQMRIS